MSIYVICALRKGIVRQDQISELLANMAKTFCGRHYFFNIVMDKRTFVLYPPN